MAILINAKLALKKMHLNIAMAKAAKKYLRMIFKEQKLQNEKPAQKKLFLNGKKNIPTEKKLNMQLAMLSEMDV